MAEILKPDRVPREEVYRWVHHLCGRDMPLEPMRQADDELAMSNLCHGSPYLCPLAQALHHSAKM